MAPRFFVVGDEAVLGLIVQNNSGAAQQAETKLEGRIGDWRLEIG
ncbi:MAG: hypothetical protein U0401_30085 [Anaerolineae bacterium]